MVSNYVLGLMQMVFRTTLGCRRKVAVSSRRNGRPSHAAGQWERSSHNGFEVVEGGANVCSKLR
jgi:hypothetical protein